MATRAVAELPLVVIVGPTASGKTALAITLAKEYGGEIICADSRTIYAGMDIGTAKPTAEEQASVPHWGLDLVTPDQSFSAADFKRYADAKIADIRSRGHIPFLVGGTGLYIDSVVFDYQFGPPADPALRQQLEQLTLAELHGYCYKHNITLPENDQNKRYVIRAIEKNNAPVIPKERPISTSIIVGIATDKEELRRRIAGRTEQLFAHGVVDEATILGKMYGWSNQAMTGNIYPLVRRYLEGELSPAELKEKFTTSDWRLAKRQLTWLRRNPFVVWRSLSEAKDYLRSALAKVREA